MAAYGRKLVDPRVRRGVTRLYVAIAVPWVMAFGAIALNEHDTAQQASKEIPGWSDAMESEDRALADKKMVADTLQVIGEARADFLRDAEMRAIIAHSFHSVLSNKRRDAIKLRNLALAALLILPVGAPLVWLIHLWLQQAVQFERMAEESDSPRLKEQLLNQAADSRKLAMKRAAMLGLFEPPPPSPAPMPK